MNRIQPKSLILFVIGILLMSSSFILQRYAPVSDAFDGLMKGIAIGFMLLSLVITAKYRRQGA
ncbi:MAG: hypothetical protein MUF71_09690 [Candidatus Kapabacteria bacterium]|jgi:hypothetical protein|nr:hypothetical protein [Candidatus Kapabacteria bacterium]